MDELIKEPPQGPSLLAALQTFPGPMPSPVHRPALSGEASPHALSLGASALPGRELERSGAVIPSTQLIPHFSQNPPFLQDTTSSAKPSPGFLGRERDPSQQFLLLALLRAAFPL